MKWQREKSLLKKAVVAGGFAFFIAVLATLPRLGYFAETLAVKRGQSSTGFMLVDIDCNISYNPFVYAFSWVSGRGQFSASFSIVSVPTYIGGDIKFPKWRSDSELAQEGIIVLILHEIPINFLPNFIILIGIELAKMRELYICLAGGIFGFPFGGPIAAFIGFVETAKLGGPAFFQTVSCLGGESFLSL
jgi:hypothetical protein